MSMCTRQVNLFYDQDSIDLWSLIIGLAATASWGLSMKK